MRLNVKLKATLAGKFKLKKTNTITGEVEENGWFDKLILDQGLNLKGSGAFTDQLVNLVSVGTGTTPPVNGDTAMETLVASTSAGGSTNGSNSGSSPYYAEIIVVRRFPTGTFSGEALSEVGIGRVSPTLFSRALIQTAGGAPTTITLGADDVLDVTYIGRQYLDGEVDDNTLAFNSVTDGGAPQAHTGTIRGGEMDTGGNSSFGTPVRSENTIVSVKADATLGAITGSNPLGSLSSSDTRDMAAYGAGNFYNDITSYWALTSANFGNDITGIWIESLIGNWQIVITPAIPKDNTQVFDLTIRLSWDRHTP